ncbi:MAG: hypothetical protein VW339_00825 [Quisquiliibacterium sp.]
MSHFRNMWRFVGKLLVHQGACAGVYSVTIRLGQLQGSAKPRSADLNAWAAILGKAPPARACRWRLYESMLASSQARVAPAAAPSPEARFRSATDSVSHGALLIEHLRRDDLLHTLQTWLTIPDVQRLLHSEDRIDQFLKMSRLDSRAIAAGRATGG